MLTNELLRIKPRASFQTVIPLIYNSVFDSLDSRFLDKTFIFLAVLISSCPLTNLITIFFASSPFFYLLKEAFHCRLFSSFYLCPKQPVYFRYHLHVYLSKVRIC